MEQNRGYVHAAAPFLLSAGGQKNIGTGNQMKKTEYTVREYFCSWRLDAMEEEKKKCYYRSMGNKRGFERAAGLEADRRLMESYYPRRAGLLKALDTDECDRLEYEGSFIYDEYPDRRNIERICREISSQAREYPELQAMEKKEEGEAELLDEFIGALFCQEIHQRRCMRKLLR